jgi:hypothetical protein
MQTRMQKQNRLITSKNKEQMQTALVTKTSLEQQTRLTKLIKGNSSNKQRTNSNKTSNPKSSQSQT